MTSMTSATKTAPTTMTMYSRIGVNTPIFTRTGVECLRYDSHGSDGFSDSIDGTWTMAFRAKQKIASFYVIAFNNPGITERSGRIDSSSTQRVTVNTFYQTVVAGDIEEDFQFQCICSSIQSPGILLRHCRTPLRAAEKYQVELLLFNWILSDSHISVLPMSVTIVRI